ncbi:hypothetical protein IKF74_02695 [Candidatus Saccharibacteria bacterium]|nr:hypothetical protein [Candidatus Saccharibacteria bacterium]
MNTVTLTQNEAIAAGGLLGGMLASTLIFALVFYVLLIVAWWKVFTKAGEAGWKSIIPIYNIYIFCRIIGINFWIYAFAIPIVLSILFTIATGNVTDASQLSTFGTIMVILYAAYAIFFEIYTAIKLGDAFKKGTGFKVGLVLLPNLFLLILAFGASKYHGEKAAKK